MNKPEPLKNKIWCLRHRDTSRMTKCEWVANVDSIQSAVELLKIELACLLENGDLYFDSMVNTINETFNDVIKKQGSSK